MLTRTSAHYTATFSVGEKVCVASLVKLIQFQRDWQFHHAITEAQLPYANRETTVLHISFYHMGTALYELEGIPFHWHEPCLMPVK